MDIFGNKVYGTVQQLYPAFAKQVTGMLLELGEERLVELLGNKDQFIQHIHKAAKVVMETELNKNSLRDHHCNQDKTKDNSKTLKTVSVEEEKEKEQIGGQIYLKVVDQCPKAANKITGMLLEMDIESLRRINNDDDLLMERISQAVQALHEQSCFDGDDGHRASKRKGELFKKDLNLELNITTLREQLHGLEEDMQKEVIGEELYKILFNIYPNCADRITGMILEMNSRDLLETLANTDLLQNRVEQAIEALASMEQS